jgi:hypothetical protein
MKLKADGILARHNVNVVLRPDAVHEGCKVDPNPPADCLPVQTHAAEFEGLS